MILFVIATLSPVAAILTGICLGGLWAWLALGSVTVLVFSLDRLTPEQIENAAPEAEFPGSDGLLIVLALMHLALLPISLWAVAGSSGLVLAERGVVGLAMSLLYGQIAHPVAHELIHKPSRALNTLGKLVYTSILFGHHASAHLRVHHVSVGSDADPNSARPGEGFYRFALRAWPAGFLAGLRAENRLRTGQRARRHPYLLYLCGALAALVGAYVIAGLAGVGALCAISLYAQLQILMSDYVQHYGLRRYQLADGRLEPVGPQHAWNAPHWYSSAMTLNATRHSDHHTTPSRRYPALKLDEESMPCLPYSLPVMAGVALVPPLWRRIMDPRCARWQPVWVDTRAPVSRVISPAVPTRAKYSGPRPGDLPELDHENICFDPLRDPRRDIAARRRYDDCG